MYTIFFGCVGACSRARAKSRTFRRLRCEGESSGFFFSEIERRATRIITHRKENMKFNVTAVRGTSTANHKPQGGGTQETIEGVWEKEGNWCILAVSVHMTEQCKPQRGCPSKRVWYHVSDLEIYSPHRKEYREYDKDWTIIRSTSGDVEIRTHTNVFFLQAIAVLIETNPVQNSGRFVTKQWSHSSRAVWRVSEICLRQCVLRPSTESLRIFP